MKKAILKSKKTIMTAVVTALAFTGQAMAAADPTMTAINDGGVRGALIVGAAFVSVLGISVAIAGARHVFSMFKGS